ncbi:hypothetical protein LMH87_007150 [Akanthomyces muscarius]|uniref:Helicase ATP-binding domain-containing protein n=1 Tax=Akanthomyces muscarius TaxID=2231603 RepID=A0A9W8UTH7_AKAMU|nr:hypothetical protein LMH87_007150 [Akanthomyces muscarius]KAJ4165520.1 hypothetical protein LMH87_007150 [Akanthomyces muscarius]
MESLKPLKEMTRGERLGSRLARGRINEAIADFNLRVCFRGPDPGSESWLDHHLTTHVDPKATFKVASQKPHGEKADDASDPIPSRGWATPNPESFMKKIVNGETDDSGAPRSDAIFSFLDAGNSAMSAASSIELRAVHRIIEATTRLGGAFFWEAAGRDRALSSIVAAHIVRKQNELPGYILVVCPEARVAHWYNQTQRSTPNGPSNTLLLSDSNVPAETLSRYDVVICTETFLSTSFNEITEFEHFSKVQRVCGMSFEEASKIVRPPAKRPSAPLHSYVAGKRAAILIVDDAHHFSVETSLLNRAVRSLQYEHCVLVTATPMPNSWDDISGQMRLLPGGGPFSTVGHFRHVLTGQLGSCDRPHPSGLAMLETLLGGLVVGQAPSTFFPWEQ